MSTVFPPPFGLHNTGSICHFNGLLQALISCPAFIRCVLSNEDYLKQTSTGTQLYKFIRSVEDASCVPGATVDPSHSYRILQAFVRDLRHRCPTLSFGQSMESASEGLVLLLDMLEPPSPPCLPDASESSHSPQEVSEGQKRNVVANLFRCDTCSYVWCPACAADASAAAPEAGSHRGVVSRRWDVGYQLYFFHYDDHFPCGITPTAEEFTKKLTLWSIPMQDYKCERCAESGRPSGTTKRIYSVESTPSILVVVFNQYGEHKLREFPRTLKLKEAQYALVAQVEHAGGLTGGHYWARGLRRKKETLEACILNDEAVTHEANLAPSAATYAVFYHRLRSKAE